MSDEYVLEKQLNLNNWTDDYLGSLSKIIYGQSPKNILDDNGDCLVIGTGNDIRAGNNYLIDGETIIIGRKGTIDKPYYYRGRVWIIDTAYYLLPFDSIIPKYLFYFLCTVNLQNLNSSTGVPSLSRIDLEKINISFPSSKTEQRKIASILTTIDNIIEKTKDAIEKYKSIKQGMMQDLFTRGIDPRTGNLRPKYDDAPELYKECVLGNIPKEWCYEKLENITNYIDYRGKTPPKSESGIFLITARNIKNGFIDYEISKEFIPQIYYETTMSRGKPEIGDVIITTEAPLGNVAQIDIKEIALAQRVIKYCGKKDIIINDFLKLALMSSRFQSALQEESTGSTVKGIKGSRMHKLKILFPSQLIEQKLIVKKIIFIDNNIETNNNELKKFIVIRQGLMQDLLTGKKRVKVNENLALGS